MATAIVSSDELWRDCAGWLTRLDVLRSDHRANGSKACIVDLANILRDGVLLCTLANKLDPGCIDFKDVNQKPQLAQFLCLRNIQIFLKTCKDIFGLKESDLFDQLMLFDLSNFHKVLCTLAKLSTSQKAQKTNIPGFYAQKSRTKSQEDIYQSLQTFDARIQPDYNIGDYSLNGNEEIYQDLCSIRPRLHEFVGQPTLEKRDYVIKELVDTETNYVDVLDKLRRNFMRPLKPLLTAEEHSTIFCEINELSEIHTGFLSQLHMACAIDNTVRLSDVFLKWRERFLIYGRYCSNLPIARNILQDLCEKNDMVNQEVSRCQQEHNQGKFQLRDVLSVPMQRILKYHLLLQKLIEETEPNHEEYQDLKRAREAMVDVANYINEVARDSEHLNILQDLQTRITDWELCPGRQLKQYGRLIRDAELKIKAHDDQKVRNRYVFIFDMVMILCKQIKGDSFSYRDTLDLKDYRIEDCSSRPILNREARWSYQWILVKRDMQSVYTLYARTVELKNVMIKAIETATDNIEPSVCRRTTHKFEMFSFDKPVSCNRCSKFLKGLIFQGYKCKVCDIAVHKDCIAHAGRCGVPPVPAPHPLVGSNPQLSIDGNNGIQLQDKLWFAGQMERTSASHMLENRLEGTYLVRIRPHGASNSDRFALSLKTNDTVKHMKVCSTVQNSAEKYYFSQSRYFNSIVDLINNYQNMSLRENFERLDEHVRLKYPYRQLLCAVTRDFIDGDTNHLNLKQGTQVLVIEKEGHPDGWWKGKINDSVGYFPQNCVKAVEEVTYDVQL